jgi:hypothetical protein
MERETGCDGVMIGRGALLNPFIFNQIVSQRHQGAYRWLQPAEILRIILDQFHAILEGEDEKNAMHKMRTFAGWYSRGIPGGAELRRRINAIQDPQAFIAAVEATLTGGEIDLDPRHGPSYNPLKGRRGPDRKQQRSLTSDRPARSRSLDSSEPRTCPTAS